MTMDLFSLGAAAPRTTRGVPFPQNTVTPNSQQVRAETAAADAVIPTEGLDVGMTTVTSGAGVPIVFCREVDGLGGCWVSPPCVQYGFVVDASDNVDIGYTVVVGQGEYPTIPEADVYYGSVLFNTLTDYSLVQDYEAFPFNVAAQTVIDPGATLELPTENGSGGTFQDVTLLGGYARLTAPAVWDRQIHIFMRNGVEVDRYIEGTVGSSNNFADLVRYLLASSGEVQDGLIDDESLETAAQFLDASGIYFSGVLSGTSSLGEYIDRTAPLFFCVSTRNQGKVGILPALPLADDFTISTDFISPSLTYTMADIVQGTFRIQYVPAVERKPFQAVMAWRDPLVPGKTTQTTVSYSGRAVSGPYEQYDLTAFCASEEQAIKVGRYILAQRLYVGHSISFQLLPNATAPAIGDLIRVVRDVMPNGAPDRREAFVYRVTRLAFSVDGVISVTALHHPRDESGASQIAQEIVPSESLTAQVPEDWAALPPFDGAVPPAVVGNPDVIAAAGGDDIFYRGEYKYHVFHRGFSTGTLLSSQPSGDNYVEYRTSSRPDLVQYIEFPSDGAGGFLFRTGGSSILTGTSADVDSYAAALIASGNSTSDPRGQFRIFSAPPDATIDYLVVGGGGMAISPGGAGYVSGGGGNVLTGTLAARAGYYYCKVGLGGFMWRSIINNLITYRGSTEQSYSASTLTYSETGFGSNIEVVANALGGANAFDDAGLRDGRSGTLFGVGANNGSTYGGGGGAGSAGYAAPSSVVGGDGGDGITSSIFGFPATFGKGGGGGVGDTSVPSPVAGDSGVTPGCGGGGVNGNQVPNGTYDTPGIMGRHGLIVIRYRYQ